MTKVEEALKNSISSEVQFSIGKAKMIADARILYALHQSTLIAELRDFEIQILADFLTIKQYQAGDFIAKPDECSLSDALLILVDGEIEVSATVDNEPMSLRLNKPGELARIISFVGSNIAKIEATIEVKKDCTVLLLERTKLENLLRTQHHTIVYYVMRGLVRHTHLLARHKGAEIEEMSKQFSSRIAKYILDVA
ncbi:MAG: cyclic nucleotide-binding domain-containing protein [Gallionella sp.]|nr:cyclic nucleotide-binding domain-containing protein [Gallionella sp.]